MNWHTQPELDDLVARFRAGTLPKSEWTHLAHLAVGTWHVHRIGPDGALAELREGIRRLNDAHGTANTDTGGYHETITRAYVRLIASFLSGCDGMEPADCVRAILASPLSARDVLLIYYSNGVLMSVEARRGWVEPDRAPLPDATTAAPRRPSSS
jgi:hypothetical protein